MEAATSEEEEHTSAASETVEAPSPTGIPACDEYLTKYTRCLEEHTPEDIRDALVEAHELARQRFIEEAADPANHEHLSKACEVALDAVKGSAKSWGCRF